ncbi:DNA internalization-related competence protein ComEC/Rec2 [Paludifilum halophilum]|uniref:DNA internalization-related competence protein ComEC/Rec2 n=1 Tax=Paludifilum halophilum TaxID=1642702 RepID=UPI00146ADC27|nr:DNA internalization-related competence protein ComEC/Rec2 [Paludifilum halophilum]
MALAWASGIGLGAKVPLSGWIWGLAALIFLLLGIVFHYYRGRLLLLGLCLAAVAAGAAQFQWVDEGNRTGFPAGMPEDQVVTLRGEAAEPPEVDGDSVQFPVDVSALTIGDRSFFVSEETVVLRTRLQQPSEKEYISRVRRGWRIQAEVRLKEPEKARNPGAFNYREYLSHRGIYWVADAESLHRIRFLPRGEEGWRSGIDRLRQFLGEKLEAVYPEQTAGLMRGMLLGERSQVPASVERAFEVLGLVHLLAISGLHVGVFVGCLYAVLTGVGVTREKTAGTIILLLPLYALLTGAGAPVIRASIMAGLGLTAVILRRWKDGLSFWGAAGLAMLWWNPYRLFEVGFQLSFLVTGALLIAVAPVSRALPFPWRRLNQLIAVTGVAQAASFPLLIYHFNEFSFLSWGLNVIVVPVVSLLVIPLSLGALGLGVVHEGAAWLPATLSSTLVRGLLDFLRPLAAQTGFHGVWPSPSGWWLAGYGSVALYILWVWAGSAQTGLRHRLLSLCLMIGLLFYAYHPDIGGKEELRVTFLDVGQGDCTVIETPRGKVILVDGGGTLPFPKEDWQKKREEYDVGEKVVVPFLKNRGIRHIDALVITHGDADHIGGLKAVAERFPVDRVIRNSLSPNTSTEKELMHRLSDRGADFHTPAVSGSWALEPGVSLRFLHPAPAEEGERIAPNDASVVFLLTAYGRQILMTGDIEEEAEKKIVRRWDLPRIDLLKAAHHGSDTSTGEPWLEEIRPRSTVISVGRDNRFGHPAPEVLKRLREHGTRIFRTDRHGAVTFRIELDGWKVETMLEGGETRLSAPKLIDSHRDQ